MDVRNYNTFIEQRTSIQNVRFTMTYINQSTESKSATFSAGMFTTLHNIVTITIAALGIAAEDMLANVQENLRIYRE